MKIIYILMCVVSGIITGLALSCKSLWFMIFISIIPLYCAIIKTDKTKNIYLYLFFYSVSYYFMNVNWIFKIENALPFERFKFTVLFLIILLLAFLQSLYFIIPFCFFNKTQKNTFNTILIFSGFYMMGEWIPELIPFFGFPWCRLSCAAVQFREFIGSSSIFGGIFITFLICIINACFGEMLICIKQPKKVFSLFLFSALIFTGNIIYGKLYYYILNKNTADNISTEITMIKSGSGKKEKWSNDIYKDIDKYIEVSKRSLTEKTKAVIWSETAVNTDIEKNNKIKNKIISFCNENKVSLLTGIITYEDDKYNSVVEFSPNGSISKSYSKQILVPFGEFIPYEAYFKEKFSGLENYRSFSAKKESSPIDTEIGKAGAIICFESVFPRISREISKNGAEFLIVVSNDSWFENSPAAFQHFCHAVIRAAENGKYLARCSTGGITAVISPDAKIFETDNYEYAIGEIKNISNRTPYTLIGDAVILYPLSIILLSITKIKKESPSGDTLPK